MQSLEYQGKQMKLEAENAPLRHLARVVARGYPVIIELEPGDATHYHLLVVPAWAASVREHLGRFGIPVDRCWDYLIVTQLYDDVGNTFYVPAWIEGQHDIESRAVTNDWSRVFLSWWLQHFWHIVKEGLRQETE